MASAESHMIGKRRHVETERMKEFRAVEEESKDKKRKCPVEGCNKFFTSKPGLRYHMQTHSPTKTSFKCPVCKRCFMSLNGLKYHKDKKDSCKKPSRTPKQDPHTGNEARVTTDLDSSTPQLQNLPFSPNGSNRLRDLAIIATGPQSPLLQTTGNNNRYGEQNQVLDLSCKSTKNSKESTIATSARPPSLPSSPTIDSTSGHKFHSWPTVVWQCFLAGTRLNFSESMRGDQWITAEVLAQQDRLRNIASQVASTAHHNPRNSDVGIKITDIKIENNSVTLFFIMDAIVRAHAVAQCSIDHPFFVKDKGWCSCATQQTSDHYGIPCQNLEVNDVCLPPSHPEATYSKVYDSIPFTSMDSDAVMTLSSMAQKKTQESPKAKRPMNGFMLFAKKKRLEYTQKHPGKDNRAISKLLGEEWKTLEVKNKEEYKEEAKQLSKQQVKMFPDCWKRKR